MSNETTSDCNYQYVICTNCQKVTQKKGTEMRGPQQLTSGPSAFISETEFVQDVEQDDKMLLLVKEFSLTGRLNNLTQVMGLHPQYLESFLHTQYQILHIEGPLPQHYRHYIAVMAAARHQCSYLVNMHINEFMRSGKDAEWLKGFEYIPQRLKNLNEINKILAHRPWLITKQHIQKLIKTGKNSWNQTELVHAVVLLANYHALAGFVLGCGINPEAEQCTINGIMPEFCMCDLANDNSVENPSFSSKIVKNVDYVSELEALLERMRRLQEDKDEEGASQEEMATRFEKEKKESFLVLSEDFEDEPVPMSDVLRYVEDPTFGYKDFARGGEDQLPTFRAQDYSWEDHGYSLVHTVYSDIGNLLDDKFRMVYNLTYNTMATHEDVDTTMLRRALFNYVQCMFGIRYDDYDYGEVNQLLEKNLKKYIKTVTCYPERTTKRMYDGFWHQFTHSEKVHVNVLLMEARMQAELLYALRAITHFIT
ncbi:sestrin-3 [Protopterus annectens]|uniref:sestrin-3 n=1 Tax=Protopterus annectens TaxID=7888 RepID=UPI001CFB6829|nr:sestrin-3 [Protopterus annectens]